MTVAYSNKMLTTRFLPWKVINVTICQRQTNNDVVIVQRAIPAILARSRYDSALLSPKIVLRNSAVGRDFSLLCSFCNFERSTSWSTSWANPYEHSRSSPITVFSDMAQLSVPYDSGSSLPFYCKSKSSFSIVFFEVPYFFWTLLDLQQIQHSKLCIWPTFQTWRQALRPYCSRVCSAEKRNMFSGIFFIALLL